MKKKFSTSVIIMLCLAVLSCGSKQETATSVAQKWCDLNAKAYKASDEASKEKAVKARKEFENKMEAKYKENKAFMDELEKEVEKCEAASEGR